MSQKRKLTPFRRKYLRFRVSEGRRLLKLKAIEYKGGKCEMCGYNKYPQAMVFHHLNPEEKDFGISNSNTRKFEKVKPELDKCILLCANCHLETHAKIEEQKRLDTIKEINEQKRKLNPSIEKNCFQCQLSIVVFASQNAEKNFCSRVCRDEYFNNNGWPSDQELIDMKEKMSVKEIEAKIGKSWRSIYKRLSKINKK